jgi:hypothetical protein
MQATSFKPQAASIKLQATSGKLFNIFSFVKFNAIKFRDTRSERLYCERRTELPVVTFSSTVKNVLFLLYPNRSGVPNELMFSILVHKILGVNAFHSFQNLLSGFKVTGICYYRSYYWKQLIVVIHFLLKILRKW